MNDHAGKLIGNTHNERSVEMGHAVNFYFLG